jgi:SAM-dependent methyltransferase
MTGPGRDADYILGTSAEEQQRLRAQGDAVGPITERLLREAGLAPGMRVLDVGCGVGDVSILAARLVGAEGEVLGVDREAAPLAAARQRVAALGLPQVRFVQADFRELGPEHGPFDAAVGRLVLMYQADPAAALREVAGRVRPGGLLAFQEYDSTVPPASLGPLPLHAKMRHWIWETLRRSGAEIQMGFKLYPAFVAAGLPPPEMHAEAVVQTPARRQPGVALVRVLLPRIVEYGIATREEVDVDSLDGRLQRELEELGSPYVGQVVFGAWCRRP